MAVYLCNRIGTLLYLTDECIAIALSGVEHHGSSKQLAALPHQFEIQTSIHADPALRLYYYFWSTDSGSSLCALHWIVIGGRVHPSLRTCQLEISCWQAVLKALVLELSLSINYLQHLLWASLLGVYILTLQVSKLFFYLLSFVQCYQRSNLA